MTICFISIYSVACIYWPIYSKLLKFYNTLCNICYYIIYSFLTYYSTFLAFWIFISILFSCMKALNKKIKQLYIFLESTIFDNCPVQWIKNTQDKHISRVNKMISRLYLPKTVCFDTHTNRIPNFSKQVSSNLVT